MTGEASVFLTGTLPALLLALLRYNAALALGAVALALPLACAVAAAHLSPNSLVHGVARVYVNALRSMPLVMLIFWTYTVGPLLTGRPGSATASVFAALTAFEVAYFAEIVRSGLASVGTDQRAAALASGLTGTQAFRHVVLPQAVLRMTPSLLTQTLIAFQDTTIASVVSVPDVLQTATIINAREQNPILLYSTLAAIYFLVCFGLGRAVRRLERAVGTARGA